MLSKTPIWLEKVDKEDINKEILRAAVMAELDAISLYEQMAAKTEDNIIKEVLLSIAKEEKTHIGELQELLVAYDDEYADELEEGANEVVEMINEYPYDE